MATTIEIAESQETPRMVTTRVFEDIMRAWLDGKRGILMEGGTSSGKTWSALQFLHLIASSAQAPLVISVVSESLPHLKIGCIRDYFKINGDSQDSPRWSRTDFIYRYPNGSMIEFWGADNEGKARGPRRDVLFINEANNVPWHVVQSADARTSRFVMADWNPTCEFWAHQYGSGDMMIPGWLHDKRFAYSHSTYRNSLGLLPQDIIDNIEAHRDLDPKWWNVYGLGKPGTIIEGLVYPLFNQCKSLPEGTVFYGLDFGFSADPAVLVANVIIGGDLYSQEIVYQRGLTNEDISRLMKLRNVKGRIHADPAEPKSIEELRQLGWDVKASDKGPGSVEFGHQRVRQFNQWWTSDSVNCIKEQRNFRYLTDRDGKPTERTTHEYSHGLDARRYAVAAYQPEGVLGYMKHKGVRRMYRT